MKNYAAIILLGLALLPGLSGAEGVARTDKDLLRFEPDDTLEEVLYKIDYNGYDFTVCENWVTELSPEERAQLLSRHAPLEPAPKRASDDIGPLAALIGRQALPTSFDWRNASGSSYVNAIRDQGYCGACYAFAAAAAFEGSYNVGNNLTGGSRAQFSDAFIAFCLDDHYSGFDGCDGSSYDYEELDALVDYGDCTLAQYPYPSSAYNTGISATCPFSSYPATTKAFSWHRIPCNDVTAIKTAIYNYGPVDAAVNVGTAFEGYSGGIYNDSYTTCWESPCYYTPTNHCISLVGWDDNPPEGGGGVWILRNSWGSSWGESGYMRIRYQAAHVACEACYIVTQGSGGSSDYHVNSGDYNGDGYDDIAVYRPSTSQWRIRFLSNVYFGQSGDQPVPADYNGDGTTDLAYFRPSTGMWKVRYRTQFYFGTSADRPVQADYDGDGSCNAAYFRPSTGMWKVRYRTTLYFGTSQDTPIPGDYHGDGTANVAYFRPSSALWKYRKGGTTFYLYYGQADDTPVPGDYTNSGYWRPAIFRPTSSQWRIYNFTRYYFGNSSVSPVPGNFYGVDQVAYFEPSTSLWKVKGFTRLYFGRSDDIPVTR